MRFRSGFLCALGVLALSALLKAADGPKLAVVIVVDQMRADYVDRFQGDWTSGLKRLVTDGARFTAAAYPYLGTLTCAGHATIGSGTFPSTHGIFQNTWFDRGRNGIVTCTDDAAVNAVSYGEPITGGDSAAALRVTNFADQMKQQKGSRVVSMALKARSAIMLGGHHADAVTWMSESPRAWQTSTAYVSQPVPAVAAYLRDHPITRDLASTWERLLPANRYREDDNGLAEAPPAGWSATFPHPLSSGAADEAFYSRWERSPFADRYIGAMAAGLADAMQLGQRGVTDVLTVSFSSPDLVGHAFGPNSQEVHDMYAHLDRTIGALLDHLDATLGKGQYVVGLSADHGVTELPEQIKAAGRDGGRVNTQAIAAAIETAASAALGQGRYVARINGSDIYFAPGQYEKLKQNPAALQAVLRAIAARPGIDRVLRSEELTADSATFGTDGLRRAAALSYVPGRSGDLVLALKSGWINVGTGTTHGSANADDQRVPLLFYGYGIKPGTYPTSVTPADLVPTLAAVAGITLPDASGRPLRPALQSVTPSSARGQQ